LEGYETVAVIIRDSHSQAGNYDSSVIDGPILTTALEKHSSKFLELLEDT